jgi:hypothetical protein
MFVQWSMWETGYNNPVQNAQDVAQNNDFGQQRGWAGSVACPSNPLIPSNTQNACFPASMTWAQELAGALGATSPTTGATYLGALESALPTGTIAGDLQAIANNGWNGSQSYGSQITGGVNIQSLINCAQQNGYMH